DSRGGFSLYNSGLGDTITFSYVGYQQQVFVHHRIKGDSITIMLKPSSFDIEEVVVQGLRNFKADSLRFREDMQMPLTIKKQGLRIFLSLKTTIRNKTDLLLLPLIVPLL